jgi:hypothetical protein
LDQEPGDDFWNGDWLEMYIFDANGLIPKKSKKKKSETEAARAHREATLLAAQRQVSQNILSISRPGTRTGSAQQTVALHADAAAVTVASHADAAAVTAISAANRADTQHDEVGLEDDGGGDEDPREAQTNPIEVSVNSQEESEHEKRPKSALRKPPPPESTGIGHTNEVDFATNDDVYLFEDSEGKQAIERRPDTAIHFFGDGRQQTATTDRPEDQFVNTGEVETAHSLVDQESASGFGGNLHSDTETQTGFQLIVTYGASVRQSKTIPLTSSSWNELIRIPIREGIRFQGQGKANVKLIKRINNAEETVGECKLEVAKLLPHKTDFSVLNISGSVQLSLQAAFVPQRVQVI